MNEQTMTTQKIGKQAFTVEPARLEDAEVLAEILSSAVQNKVDNGDMAWGTEPYTAEELQERIEKGNTYIAILGSVPIGTLLLIWEDEMMWGKQSAIAAYVHQLAVKKEYRGQDIGEKLLDWASQQAANNGRKLLRIDFPPENDGLRAYYEKLGFKWVKNREIHAPHATYTAALYERPTTK